MEGILKVTTKPFLIGGLLLLITAYALIGAYNKHWSPAAQARKVGDAFLRAAVAGDQGWIGSMLAADSDLTPAQVVELYREFRQPKAFDVIKSLPNRSGVEYLVNAGGAGPAGFTRTTTIALKREGGRWMVLKAGSSLSY